MTTETRDEYGHTPECAFRRAACAFYATHVYCPHPEHGCDCAHASADSVKAEETEGAKEGLGVGEHKPGTCWDCGKKRDHTWHAGPWRAGYSHIYRATQPTDAPPSAPDRTPNPVPDQVLTPLSVLAELRSAASTYVTLARCIENGWTMGDSKQSDIEWLRTEADRLTAIAAAALAGVPKEAEALPKCETCDHIAVSSCHHGISGDGWTCPAGAHRFKPIGVAAPVEDATNG